MLKLADRSLGYCSGKGRPAGVVRNCFELIYDVEHHRSRNFGRIGCGRPALGATSCQINGTCGISTFAPTARPAHSSSFCVVRLCIITESTPLHPITDVVQRLVFDYIPGVSMVKLTPGVGVPEQEAERISSQATGGIPGYRSRELCLAQCRSHQECRSARRQPISRHH
ncbi:hypothetical protein EDD18DRAFT_521317 [Armillaria luteobubalina]|uniref:Uncharacterized protein n=1 Tax=Armillaria luteobubalina TaxID=153913 RepID=A0AA39PWY6_9AGAR|nr:hypothetical protein EDD18DRAFT_521317 [Armillaria luteobubalina]